MERPIVHITPNCLVEGGRIQNEQLSRDVDYFLGIPYGEAVRFERPTFAKLWAGIRLATTKGKICPQDFQMYKHNFLPLPIPDEETDMSEDCLSLNIWRPSDVKEGEKLPVLVWLCSAHFKTGSANTYSGEVFSSINRAIVVSINYRLGVLGFACSHDGVLEGNYMLLDHILALKWIQKYIEGFGGDKDNVTLHGVSSSSILASVHLISQKSKGLFHKMILQSGSILGPCTTPCTRKFMADLILSAAKHKGYNGSANGEELKSFLQALPIHELTHILHPNTMLTPVIDGYVIEEEPDLIYEKELYSKVPVLGGVTSDEGFAFLALLLKKAGNKIKNEYHFKDLVVKISRMLGYKYCSDETGSEMCDMIMKIYQPKAKLSENFMKSCSKVNGDMAIVAPMYKQLQVLKDCTTYAYEIHYRPSYYTGPEWIGMPHANDLSYVFGDPFLSRYLNKWTDSDKQFSRNLMERWGEFIKTGELTDWKPFNLDNKSIKILKSDDDRMPKEAVFKKKNMKFWNNEIYRLIKDDESPITDEEFNIDDYMFLVIAAFEGAIF
ncbi:DgyrCDS5181 [Dimorphilus gyrociliatus]|uniref:DgyrCDS5181 n=1 Tax=Dimorphilus gyrociliatus TaxID=2664684 RepID=A0A7I8VJ78_9ANNE|nr:DgyrCDS5181 [Dimorphilus gyrociliatus]